MGDMSAVLRHGQVLLDVANFQYLDEDTTIYLFPFKNVNLNQKRMGLVDIHLH